LIEEVLEYLQGVVKYYSGLKLNSILIKDVHYEIEHEYPMCSLICIDYPKGKLVYVIDNVAYVLNFNSSKVFKF
jgi:hypothetical protein